MKRKKVACTGLPAAEAAQVGEPLGAVFSTAAPGALIQLIKVGLPLSALEGLRRKLDLPEESFAKKLGISRATLHRRKTAGKLAALESDRLVRFARLTERATEVLGSLEEARKWLKTPQRGLGGERPLDYAQTEVGAREVENLLGRIEYGVLA
jgi:putative toxin-antitoxin system antitoxin component (TIGR02293 family)